MIIGRSSTTFCFLCRSEIQDGCTHSINPGPYGENTEICSSLKLLHQSLEGPLQTVFFMLIGIPR